MKRIASGIVLGLLGCFLLIASRAGAASDSTTEKIEARRVVEQYFSALNAGGLETVMNLYHADSVSCLKTHLRPEALRKLPGLSNAL